MNNHAHHDPALEIAGMSQAEVSKWLKNRLSGSDPIFPINTKHDEDPEDFVIALLLNAGAHSPAHQKISIALNEVLKGTDIVSNDCASPSFYSAIHLLQRTHVPEVANWLLEQAVKVNNFGDPSALPDPGAARELLLAAARQRPAVPESSSTPLWKELLGKEEFSSVALQSFGDTIISRLPYLNTWWTTEKEPNRSLDLEQQLLTAVQIHGDRQTVEQLRSARGSFDLSLRDQVNAFFHKHYLPIPFPLHAEAPDTLPSSSSSHYTAICGAGLKPEFQGARL